MGAALGLAIAFTIGRSAKHMSMVPAVGVAYLISTVVVLPFAEPTSLSGMSWVYALLLGCIFVPIGTGLMALGPRYISSAEVSLLLLLESIFAPILIWIVLGEFPGNYALVGGAIVLGVLIASNLLSLRKSRAIQPA